MLIQASQANSPDDGRPDPAPAFALSLRVAVEEALTERIRRLRSHIPIVEYAVAGGHRTRPLGCLLASAAVGGDWRTSIHAAVGVELAHKSSVIRDDIADGDEMRSGQPAVHVAFGVPTALAVSDLLWTLALTQVSECRLDGVGTDNLREFTNALHEMASGQLEDVAPSPDCLSTAQRLAVEQNKTGRICELGGRLGARIGGGTREQIDALGSYGLKLGTAFQVLNDVRNLRGAETSRALASDVRKRRDTVLSAYARDMASSDVRAFLDDIRRGAGDLADTQFEAARDAILSSGAIAFGEGLAHSLMTDARAELMALRPSVARSILDSLTRDSLLAHAF